MSEAVRHIPISDDERSIQQLVRSAERIGYSTALNETITAINEVGKAHNSPEVHRFLLDLFPRLQANQQAANG